jgi:3-methyladenine DNA glycosylase AlkD
MTAQEIVAELAQLGSPSTKQVLMRHGAREPFFGVKIEDLKKIQKRIKKDHALALELFDTGIGDAMYLAGLIADPRQMKKADLRRWVKQTSWPMVSEYTVPWVAAESPHGVVLAREWIDSPREGIAAAGWATYGSVIAITPDDELDLEEIAELLDRVQAQIHKAPNRVRYTMNGFVIGVGSYVTPLAARAKAVARAIGKVEVDMGGTACKVPDALEYIAKVESRGKQGTKRKTAFC